MANLHKTTLAALSGFILSAGALSAAIQINSGSSDFTIFYNPAGEDFNGEGTEEAKWHFVARAKGDSSGTANGDPFVQGNGDFSWSGSGGSADDYTYSSFTAVVTSPQVFTRHGQNYFITPASGTNYTLTQNPNDPDIGIRTRLNDAGAAGFANVRFTIDMAVSTFNGVALQDSSADFLLFRDEPSGVTLIDTFDEVFEWENVLSGHTHYNWGFSEQGEYSLTFNVQGFDADGLATGIPGSGTMDFSVVPEPSTYAAILGALVLGLVLVRRRRRS